MIASDAFRLKNDPKARPKWRCTYQGKPFGYCFADTEEEAVADCIQRNPRHLPEEFAAFFYKWEVPHP